MIVHSNGAAVIDQIFEWTTLIFEPQRGEFGFLCVSNINRRLLFAGITNGIIRIQITPMRGAARSLVIPWRLPLRSGRRFCDLYLRLSHTRSDSQAGHDERSRSSKSSSHMKNLRSFFLFHSLHFSSSLQPSANRPYQPFTNLIRLTFPNSVINLPALTHPSPKRSG